MATDNLCARTTVDYDYDMNTAAHRNLRVKKTIDLQWYRVKLTFYTRSLLNQKILFYLNFVSKQSQFYMPEMFLIFIKTI